MFLRYTTNTVIQLAHKHDGWTAKIADFGLSRITPYYDVTSSSVIPVRWCAPEVLAGKMQHSIKSDVYSFGVVLWEVNISVCNQFRLLQAEQLLMLIAQQKKHCRK